MSHLIGDSVVVGGRTCLVAKWTELRCERFPDGPDRVTWNTKYNLVIRPVRNSGDALDTVAPYLDRSPRWTGDTGPGSLESSRRGWEEAGIDAD